LHPLSDKAELRIVDKAQGCQRETGEDLAYAQERREYRNRIYFVASGKRRSINVVGGKILIYHGEEDYPFFDVKTAL